MYFELDIETSYINIYTNMDMAPHDVDARVLDYLDDKLQSLADFDTLDSLLDSVKVQQDLLKQQVRYMIGS